MTDSFSKEPSHQPIEMARNKKREADACLRAGKLAEAKSLYSEAAHLDPGDAQTWLMLGNVNTQSGEVNDAESAYRRALRLNPGLGEAHQYLGNLLGSLGHHREASDCYRKALRIKPHSVPAHINLGNVLVIQGKFNEARDAYRDALRFDPENRKAALGIAHAYERQGDPDQAFAQLQPFLSPGKVDADAAMIFAAVCRPLGRCTEAIAIMEGFLARENPPLTSAERSTLCFRLGSLYDANNDYDAAFLKFKQGNMIKAQDWGFDSQAHIRLIDALVNSFSSEFMTHAPRSTCDSQRPVFIVGMPRSGTSLVEQILASHPAVFGAGELHELTHITTELPALLGNQLPYPQCVTAMTVTHCDQLARRYLETLDGLSSKSLRVTDKMPDNFLRLGLIAMLFPHARIIHCLRDPLDTCLSCYFQNFGPGLSFTFDLASLAEYYRQYRRLMEHWRTVIDLPLLEVRYEDLVKDQERVSREMVSFCALEWDERCLRFHETDRVANTASYDQVRRPLYSRSIERWRHYARHLGPLENLAKYK